MGCHEQRSHTPSFQPGLLALNRPPSPIEPIDDVPDVLDFPRDIQPILNEHCVGCHNPDRWDGQVDLTGDHTPVYSVSYWTMVKRGLFADGRNKPYSQQAPRSIGSSASRLMKLIDGSHYGAALSERQRKTVRLWIETSATYPGTYAALGSGRVSRGAAIENHAAALCELPLGEADRESTCSLRRFSRPLWSARPGAPGIHFQLAMATPDRSSIAM